MAMLNTLVEDRKFLKRIIETHLRDFFNWDNIEYNRDFSIITLFFNKDNTVFVDSEKLSELLFNYSIEATYDDSANRIVKIEVYPFGVPNEEDDN